MTNRDFTKLAEPLMSDFPVFARHSKLLYLPLQNGLLRGVFFDSSAFSKTAFYISAFVMPLFVPTEHLTLSYGDRLRIGRKVDNWNLNDADTLSNVRDAIETQALPFLNSLETMPCFITYLENKTTISNPRNLEALGYSLAWECLVSKAAAVFEKIPPLLDTAIPWQKELSDRATEYRSQLLSDPKLAIDHLKSVESTTRTNLGLPH